MASKLEPKLGLFSKLLILPIRLYQYTVRPFLGARCRFYPSCSCYAEQAIRIHGPLKGICFAFYRIIRCQPFCKGGIDPVPNKKVTNKQKKTVQALP